MVPQGILTSKLRSTSLAAVALPATRPLISVPSNMSVVDVVKVMAQHNISSVPVVSSAAGIGTIWREKYEGIVSSVALVFWMLEQSKECPQTPDEFAKMQERFQATTVREVMDCDPENQHSVPLFVLDWSLGTMEDLCVVLGRYAVHRIFACRIPDPELACVITQSDVVRYLFEHEEDFSALTDRTISDLGLLNHAAVTISSDKTFWDAFKLLRAQMFSAVAVVDDKGRVLGNVSANDARRLILQQQRISLLHSSLQEYSDMKVEPFDAEAITCSPNETLKQVIAKLARTRVHRVWVVDAERRPTHAIALRDVLARLVVDGQQAYDYLWL